MNLEVGLRLLALLPALVAAAMLGACGEGNAEPQTSPWESVGIEGLESGIKHAAYDAGTDTLWILTWPDANIDRTGVVTGVRPHTGEVVAEVVLPVLGAGLGTGGGILVSPDGHLWMAWSRHLLKVDPARGLVEEHAIPQATDTPPDMDNPDAGHAVSLAWMADGRLAVARVEARSLAIFDPRAREWSELPTGPLVLYAFSTVVGLEDGSVAVNGLIPGESGEYRWLAAFVSATGEVTLVEDAEAFQMTAQGEGVVMATRAGALRRAGATLLTEALPGQFGMLGAPRGLSTEGTILWLWRYGFGEVYVVRVDIATGEIHEDLFPMVMGEGLSLSSNPGGLGPAPPGRAIDPALQQLIPDGNGGVWVLTYGPGDAEAYGALYRLIP